MGWVSGIVVFIMVWWTVLFAVLPWGVRMSQIEPQDGIQAAPSDPKLKQKFWMTTGISVAIWLVVFVLFEYEIISFGKVSEVMMGQGSLS